MNMGVSQERKCLLNIVSQKLISYDFCTSFVLHKVKKTFGGSKWKLIELTRVSRYLAYVRRANSLLCSQLMLVLSVVDGALVSAPPDYDCKPRYHHGHG